MTQIQNDTAPKQSQDNPAAEQSPSYAQALEALHKAEMSLETSVWVDNVRALVRPTVLIFSLLALVLFAILEVKEGVVMRTMADIVAAGTAYYFLDRSIFKKGVK